MKTILSVFLVVIVCGCSGSDNKPDSGFVVGGGGGATGGGGGSTGATFNAAGNWQLVLTMYPREAVLLDGGMGRDFSIANDGGLRVEVQHPVTFKADGAGGYGLAFALVDGGACCADGPRFSVDGGALIFASQRYRFPPGVSFQTTLGSMPFEMVTPWVLDVHDLESRAAFEVSGSVNFPMVKVETSEDGNPQNVVYGHAISFTRQ